MGRRLFFLFVLNINQIPLGKEVREIEKTSLHLKKIYLSSVNLGVPTSSAGKSIEPHSWSGFTFQFFCSYPHKKDFHCNPSRKQTQYPPLEEVARSDGGGFAL